MITLFTIPKAFEGHVGVIQRNALGSWARLGRVDVLLIGDDPGVAEAAAQFGFGHEPAVERTEYGTPLVSDAFRIASARSRYSRLGYVNTDIMLLSDFARTVSRVCRSRFLLTGRRWNTDIAHPIDFGVSDWEEWVRRAVLNGSELADPYWLDYFVLPTDSAFIGALPAFAVGRPGWDTWLCSRARETRTPLIDGTRAITAIHQAHDYSHVPGGSDAGSSWGGPEEEANRKLQSGAWLSLDHATHVMTRFGPLPALDKKHLVARWRQRHALDGGVERLGRLLEPVLLPISRVRPRVRAGARAVRDWGRRLGYIRARWPRPLGTRPPIGLAVCAIFRDEARYLAEWVSFHRIQGVERFYLYDNRSTDDWRSELEPEIAAGIVEVQHWPFVPGQLSAYEDCLRRHRDDARWIAFIDSDEFLFSPTGRRLPEVLRGFDTHPAVVANWRVYGTSGWEQPPEGLVIENYLMRAPDEDDGNRQVKSIVNPRSAMGWASAHHFRLRGDSVGEDRRPIKFAIREPTADLLRINHYFTRSRAEFERKVQSPAADTGGFRGGPYGFPVDAIHDETILQFAPQLRELLSSRTGGAAPRTPEKKLGITKVETS